MKNDQNLQISSYLPCIRYFWIWVIKYYKQNVKQGVILVEVNKSMIKILSHLQEPYCTWIKIPGCTNSIWGDSISPLCTCQRDPPTSSIHRYSHFMKILRRRFIPDSQYWRNVKAKIHQVFPVHEILLVKGSPVWPCHLQYCTLWLWNLTDYFSTLIWPWFTL